MPEQMMFEAIEECHRYIRELCELHELRSKTEYFPKMQFTPASDGGLADRLRSSYYDVLRSAKSTVGKQAHARGSRSRARANDERPHTGSVDQWCLDVHQVGVAWHDLTETVMRDLILSGTRPDGRDMKTVRGIECHVGLLPRTHGSAVFQRGETQSLVTITLGTSRDEQRVDSWRRNTLSDSCSIITSHRSR